MTGLTPQSPECVRWGSFHRGSGVRMNFVVSVDGRDAWPVRALPWVSGHNGPRWHLDAVDVAHALAWDGAEYEEFFDKGVRARRADGSAVEQSEWERLAVELEALRAKCDAYDVWQRRATLALPADAFVWADEWQAAYGCCPWGPEPLRPLLDDADPDSAEGKELRDDIAAREIVTAPLVRPALARAVMEGASALDRPPPSEPAHSAARAVEPTPPEAAAAPVVELELAAAAATQAGEVLPSPASVVAQAVEVLPAEPAAAQPETTPEPTPAPPELAEAEPPQRETPKEKRRRLTEWYVEEFRIRKRGAVQRVYERERAIRLTEATSARTFGRGCASVTTTAKPPHGALAWLLPRG